MFNSFGLLARRLVAFCICKVYRAPATLYITTIDEVRFGGGGNTDRQTGVKMFLLKNKETLLRHDVVHIFGK